MIINRYFYKEVTLSLLAVLSIILAIFISHEFVHYLAKAAAGKVPITVLLSIMAVQVPYLLGLLLPLSLYLGLLLTLGRWAVDSELIVLSACGWRNSHLLRLTLIMATCAALFTAAMTCWAIPHLLSLKTQFLARAGLSTLVDTLPAGRFWISKEGRYVAYVEEVSRDRQQMQHIFLAERQPANELVDSPHWSVIAADKARQYVDEKTQAKYLLVSKGHRFEGLAGQSAATVSVFENYGVKLQSPPVVASASPMTQSTYAILQGWDSNPEYLAELSWRIGIPLSAWLLAAMAIPLARVNPREGRFARFFPAILIYIVYANCLFVNRNFIQKQIVDGAFGLLWIHILMGLLAIILWQLPTLKRVLAFKRVLGQGFPRRKQIA